MPWLYLWLLAAQAPACLSYIEKPRSRFIFQTWQKAKITTFSLLVILFQCSPGWHWPSLLQVYVAGSRSAWCWPVLTILSCFSAYLLPSWLAPRIILLVQDLACPYAGCFQAYKRDRYLNMFSYNSKKGLFWSLVLTLFSLLPMAFAQKGERIEQCKNCSGLLANGIISRSLTTFEASRFHQSERAGMAISVFWQSRQQGVFSCLSGYFRELIVIFSLESGLSFLRRPRSQNTFTIEHNH